MRANADETASLNHRILLLRDESIERLLLKGLEPIELVQLSLMTRKELRKAIVKAVEEEEAPLTTASPQRRRPSSESAESPQPRRRKRSAKSAQ